MEAAGIQWHENVLLFKPSFPVSTEQAYKRWKFSREHADIPYGPQEIAGVEMSNDLERPVYEKHLFLAILKRKLLATEGVQGAMMSGSGSTVFAVLEEGVDGEKLATEIKQTTDPDLWTWCGEAG